MPAAVYRSDQLFGFTHIAHCGVAALLREGWNLFRSPLELDSSARRRKCIHGKSGGVDKLSVPLPNKLTKETLPRVARIPFEDVDEEQHVQRDHKGKPNDSPHER